MSLLRRVLYLQALTSAVVAVALIGFPRFLLVSVLAQPEYPDYAWVRLAGVGALSLALVMVLVGHRAEDLWWWAWAFVVGTAGSAAVLTLHAAFGLPPGAAAWAWWIAAVGTWGFAGALLWGISRAGLEPPAEGP
ncbi:MAG: hypothetical protein ACRDI0_13030 [Actinomycetota bacterium]